MRNVVVFAKTPRWRAVAADAAALTADARFAPIKRTARTLAGFVEANGGRIFVKRVGEGPWLKGWLTRWRGSRARRATRGAATLAAGGFHHPELLAAAEIRALGSVRASFIVSAALERARVMSAIVLAGGKRAFRRRRELSAAIAREIRRLHDAGIYSLDLQETNLMLQDTADGGVTIYFVDLEDVRRTRQVGADARLLNLVHLDRTIGRFLPRTHRLRFLYDYLGGRPGRVAARQVVSRALEIRTRAERRARGRRRSGDAAQPPNATEKRLSPAGIGE